MRVESDDAVMFGGHRLSKVADPSRVRPGLTEAPYDMGNK